MFCIHGSSLGKLQTGWSLTGRAAAPSAPASGGHRKLARIADEGRVTYSITLTRCRSRAGGQLPDPRCTPGSVDPAVTQATIDSTICRSGYTEGVRPPESQTTHAKYDVAYPAYHVPDRDSGELDHLVDDRVERCARKRALLREIPRDEGARDRVHASHQTDREK